MLLLVDFPSFSNSFLNFKPNTFDNCPSFNPIINSSKLYVGNDTGFMHLSAGLNIPAIGLFGDTPLSYANYTKNILPIIPENFKTIGHNSMAMNKITVDQVFNEVKKFI